MNKRVRMKGEKSFSKQERIVSQKLIDKLFSGDGSHTRAAFPLRVVYAIADSRGLMPPVQVLVSVPKRRLRLAVERNRVKRQVREAYRLNKHLLLTAIPVGQSASLAFIWQTDRLFSSDTVEERMRSLLNHIAQRLKA